jgi:hypothetical protein
MRRLLALGLAAASLAVGMWLAPAANAGPAVVDAAVSAAASASKDKDPVERCNNYLTYDAGERGEVCIVQDYPEGSRWGLVRYTNVHGDNYYVTATVYVQRCQAINNTPQNCSTIAANSGEGYTSYGVFSVRTSAKDAQYGWIYRACASLDAYWPSHANDTDSKFVNRCSPFMVGDPGSTNIMYG